MAKSIAFSADEMGELRSFYAQELAAAEERVNNIKTILSKIGGTPDKRGRKSSQINSVVDKLTEAASAAPAKKRGRPRKESSVKTVTGKKRGRKPAADKAVVSPNVDATPKRRGRPAKIKTTPVSTEPKKRGRKPKAVSAAPAITASVKPTGAKRGRKPKAVSATPATAIVKPIGAKRGRKPKAVSATPVTAVVKTTGAKRGRKPKAVSATPAGEVVKTSGAKRGRKPKAVASTPATASEVKPAGAKRGRKPKAISATPVVKTPGKRGRKPKATTDAVVAPKPAKVAKAPVAKAPKVAKAKVVKAKVVKAKVVKAKVVKPAKVAKAKVVKPAKVVKAAEPALPKKEQYREFIVTFLVKEGKFYNTDEMVSAGIKGFNLKGKEKDSAKTSIQSALNGLNADGKIIRRRKDKDRQAYWAALGTNDAGYMI